MNDNSHKDHLGSTCAMSRQDGTIIDFGKYYPFGLDKEAKEEDDRIAPGG
ncbi:MAG: hypothetical protein MI802_01360 [Desulfobacterales bacterium]|nr:hypothetical protein [Desulfobacterales bacterium]